MTDVLLIYLEHEFKTETETSLGTFDNTLIADLVDADVGYPLTTNGGTLFDEMSDEIGEMIAEGHLGAYPEICSVYHEEFCVTEDDLISEQVRIQDGALKRIDAYDVVIVSHLWAHNYYIDYLSRRFPDLPIVAVQEGSIQDVIHYSSRLQLLHRRVLRSVDGYIAQNRQYEGYVRQFVDDVLFLPLHVPKRQFQTADTADARTNEICLGVTTWNVDFSNFYTNVLVLDALQDAGHDLRGEIVGLKDFQEKRVGTLGDLEHVRTVPYIEGGVLRPPLEVPVRRSVDDARDGRTGIRGVCRCRGPGHRQRGERPPAAVLARTQHRPLRCGARRRDRRQPPL